MTWLTFALLSLLYLFIGGIVGYLLFDDDADGMMFGLFWPILLVVFSAYAACWVPFKAAVLTVNGIKKLIDILSKIEWRHRGGESITYEEKDTKCDKCDRFNICRAEGKLIKTTLLSDERKDYIVRRGVICYKDLERFVKARTDEKEE